MAVLSAARDAFATKAGASRRHASQGIVRRVAHAHCHRHQCHGPSHLAPDARPQEAWLVLEKSLSPIVRPSAAPPLRPHAVPIRLRLRALDPCQSLERRPLLPHAICGGRSPPEGRGSQHPQIPFAAFSKNASCSRTVFTANQASSCAWGRAACLCLGDSHSSQVPQGA